MTGLVLERIGAAPWGSRLLEDISLAVQPGEILALAGPNGAGKSSLLRLIAGDVAADRGRLELLGRPAGNWQRRELARHLAFLPQLSLLNFPYTVAEVVALGRIPCTKGIEVDRQVVAQAMAATDIVALGERLYTRLSGGERQRVQLARVFAQIWDAIPPGSLLLLDEPTTALDLAHQQQVLAAVRQMAGRGCAVVLVIHDLNLAAAVADRLAVLDDGRLVAEGPPAEVLTVDLFRRVFDVEVELHQVPGRRQPLVLPA